MQHQKIQEPIAIGCLAIADLQHLMKQSSDKVMIIDVRNPEEYAEKHIPGAVNIPLGELENRSKELPKQTLLITTCGKGGGRSVQAAEKLKQWGFSKAIFLCGGTFGWYDLQPIANNS